MNEEGRASLLDDPYLEPFSGHLESRAKRTGALEERLLDGAKSLADIAAGHEYYGIHRAQDGTWIVREWAPNAQAISLVGDFNS